MFENLVLEEIKNNPANKYITLYGLNCTYDKFIKEIDKYFGNYDLQFDGDWIRFKINGIEITINTNKSKDKEFFLNQAQGMKNYFSNSQMPENELKSNILKQIEMFNSIFGFCIMEPINSFDIEYFVFDIVFKIADTLNLLVLYPNMDLFDSDGDLLISYDTGKSQYLIWNFDENENKIKKVINSNIKKPGKRRQEVISILKEKNIGYKEDLSLRPTSCEVVFKNIDDICKRALICIFTSYFATEVLNSHSSVQVLNPKVLEAYNLFDYMFSKELDVCGGNCSQNDLFDISWNLECLGVLLWVLGFIKDNDIIDASQHTDMIVGFNLISKYKNYDDFKEACNLKSEEEILDKIDLYYCYHWAFIENKWHKNISAGNLNPEIVLERRRALEWLISDEYDWYDIYLNA